MKYMGVQIRKCRCDKYDDGNHVAHPNPGKGYHIDIGALGVPDHLCTTVATLREAKEVINDHLKD